MTERYINIGKIVNTQGIKGEVRVIPLTDFPERFYKMKQVLVNHRGILKTYHIETVKEHKQFFIIKFREVADMNAAILLKNTFLQVPEEELTKLPANTYYIYQLEGLAVFNEAGEALGILHEVISTGANDVWVVKSAEGQELLLPAIKQVVKQVDLERRQVLVEVPEGL